MAVQNPNLDNRDTVVAVFHPHADAQAAVRELKAACFTEEHIGIAAQDHDGVYQAHGEGNKAGAGAALGATTGLGAGALWGLGIVAGMLPAIGSVIAGGVIGALLGLGVPEEEANYYRGEMERGRTLVTA